MEQKRISFEDALAWGEEGEKEVAIKLLERGNAVVPVYQFDIKTAPMLLTLEKRYILPDLQCINYAKGFSWVEVKRKNRWVRWVDNIETGCDYRNYIHYLNVARVTNQPLYVVFKQEEEEPTGLFAVNINAEGRYWDGCKPTGEVAHEEMFFWSISQLTQIL